jgi:hypothetical protein
MMTPQDRALAPVAYAPDQPTAERWAATLERAGIEAHLRIEDGSAFTGFGSAWSQWLGGRPFVYPVLVSRVRRRAARRALASDPAFTTASPPLTGRSITAAAAVLGATMLLVLALAWARGDL